MKRIFLTVLLVVVLICLTGCETPDELRQRLFEYEIVIMDENGNRIREYKKYYRNVRAEDGVIQAIRPDYGSDYISGGIVQVVKTGNWYYEGEENEKHK